MGEIVRSQSRTHYFLLRSLCTFVVVSLTISFADQVVNVFKDVLSIDFILQFIFLLFSLSMFVNIFVGEVSLKFHEATVVRTKWLTISGIEDIVNFYIFRITTFTIDVVLSLDTTGSPLPGQAAMTHTFVVFSNA